MFEFFAKKNSNTVLKERAYSYLRSFFDTALILESTKATSISRESKRWYEMLDSIGESIVTLYGFHTFLIQEHSYFEDRPYEKQLCSFYMDIVNNYVKEYYEENLCYLFPANEIYFVLEQ